jgi:phage FluMu protein Com
MQNTTVQTANCRKLRCTEAEVVDHLYTKDNCETMNKTQRNEETATHTATTKMKDHL